MIVCLIIAVILLQKENVTIKEIPPATNEVVTLVETKHMVTYNTNTVLGIVDHHVPNATEAQYEEARRFTEYLESYRDEWTAQFDQIRERRRKIESNPELDQSTKDRLLQLEEWNWQSYELVFSGAANHMYTNDMAALAKKGFNKATFEALWGQVYTNNQMPWNK